MNAIRSLAGQLVSRCSVAPARLITSSHKLPPSNYGINATVRPVTPLAVASAAPVRPARHALRYADKTGSMELT